MAPEYDGAAVNRFPKGAAVTLLMNGEMKPVAPGLNASADPTVSFDGSRILFAGKSTAAARWQIWETSPGTATPRQLTNCASDCTRPLYLPDGRIVYTRATSGGSGLEVADSSGAAPLRLTFSPGRHTTQDVLRDGRILFESGGELFTVYPDGTGVEALRCDHGPRRGDARQISSGDVVFSTGRRLARFTAALASQTDIAQPDRESAGPIAEISPGKWVVALRGRDRRFGLYVWTKDGNIDPLATPAGANALQPALLRSRVPPREFPSALVESRRTGNLLCLDARASRQPVTEPVAAVRVYARDAAGAEVLLGRQDVAGDGSFYVEVPADRPLRIELIDRAGHTVRAERGWFWMRPSEQRICVGCHTGPERSPENKVPEILRKSTVPEKLLGAIR